MAELLDQAARHRLTDRFGPDVRTWFDELPRLVDDLCQRWDITIGATMPGSTGLTMRCRRGDGSAAVLKLTPEPLIAAEEAAALRAWSASSRVVRLLDEDDVHGALLLESLVPGTPAHAHLPVAVIADLLNELHQIDPPAGFRPLRGRVEFLFALFERRSQNLPAQVRIDPGLFRHCRSVAVELSERGPVCLLHGDLHIGNVLDAGTDRGLVVIDPRPCVGDPAFDTIDWLLIPGEYRTRITELCELSPQLDPVRLHRWCAVLAVFNVIVALRRSGSDANIGWLLDLTRTLD